MADAHDVARSGVAARRLAGIAMSLARSRVGPPESGGVLLRIAESRAAVVRLARSRCLAAVDQDPYDSAAREAVELLDDALRRLGPDAG